jgi:hypothetical protein
MEGLAFISLLWGLDLGNRRRDYPDYSKDEEALEIIRCASGC